MTTMQELRAIVAAEVLKTQEMRAAAVDAHNFLSTINAEISSENPYSGALNADQLLAIFTPMYTVKKQRIEAAADAIGTDN